MYISKGHQILIYAWVQRRARSNKGKWSYNAVMVLSTSTNGAITVFMRGTSFGARPQQT